MRRWHPYPCPSSIRGRGSACGMCGGSMDHHEAERSRPINLKIRRIWTTPKLLPHKATINSRVVIVACTDYGRKFLPNLIFTSLFGCITISKSAFRVARFVSSIMEKGYYRQSDVYIWRRTGSAIIVICRRVWRVLSWPTFSFKRKRRTFFPSLNSSVAVSNVQVCLLVHLIRWLWSLTRMVLTDKQET